VLGRKNKSERGKKRDRKRVEKGMPKREELGESLKRVLTGEEELGLFLVGLTKENTTEEDKDEEDRDLEWLREVGTMDTTADFRDPTIESYQMPTNLGDADFEKL
jgi:hypothetical protein